MSICPEQTERIGNAPDAGFVKAVVQARLPAISTKTDYVGTPIQVPYLQMPRGKPPLSEGS